MSVCGCVSIMSAGACAVQERATDALEVELQVAMSCLC